MSFLRSIKHPKVLPQLLVIDWPNKFCELITKWVMFSCARHFWLISWMCFAAESTDLNLPEVANFLSLNLLAYVIFYPLIETLLVLLILHILLMTKLSLPWVCMLVGVIMGSGYLMYYADYTALIELPFMMVLARLVVREMSLLRAFSTGFLFLFLTRFTQFFVAYTINHVIYSN